MEVAAFLVRLRLNGDGQERDEYQEAEGLQDRLQGAYNGDAPRQDVIPEELDNEQLNYDNQRNRQEPRDHLAGT